MDMLKNKFPEAVANTILLFVSSQTADIMKKIEAVNDEFEDVIGFVIDEGFKIDFSSLFFMRAKNKKERERDAKYHRLVIEYEMNKKWEQLLRKLI